MLNVASRSRSLHSIHCAAALFLFNFVVSHRSEVSDYNQNEVDVTSCYLDFLYPFEQKRDNLADTSQIREYHRQHAPHMGPGSDQAGKGANKSAWILIHPIRETGFELQKDHPPWVFRQNQSMSNSGCTKFIKKEHWHFEKFVAVYPARELIHQKSSPRTKPDKVRDCNFTRIVPEPDLNIKKLEYTEIPSQMDHWVPGWTKLYLSLIHSVRYRRVFMNLSHFCTLFLDHNPLPLHLYVNMAYDIFTFWYLPVSFQFFAFYFWTVESNIYLTQLRTLYRHAHRHTHVWLAHARRGGSNQIGTGACLKGGEAATLLNWEATLKGLARTSTYI